MSISVTGDNENSIEQIKKNFEEDQFSDKVIQDIKSILVKDEFDFFNTKASLQYDSQINSSEKNIKKLIDLKITALKSGKELKEKYNKLKEANSKVLQSISKKLE